MEERKERLMARTIGLKLTPDLIEREFAYIDHPEDSWTRLSPWDEFLFEANIHLGKRSGGWQFLWNFHNDKYYSSREELISFVKSGRVVNEYGEELTPDEFLDMAFSWCPDGIVADKEYFDKNERYNSWMKNPADYYDRVVDGLRVSSSTEFS